MFLLRMHFGLLHVKSILVNFFTEIVHKGKVWQETEQHAFAKFSSAVVINPKSEQHQGLKQH